MPNNYYDTTTKVLYNKSDFVPHDLSFKMLDFNYEFSVQTTGDFGDRQCYMTAGYKEYKDEQCCFVLPLQKLVQLRDNINKVIDEIEQDKEYNDRLHKECRSLLKEYIENDYIDHIRISKTKRILPNGFSKELYDPYHIEPVFKSELPEDAGINLGLNYIEVLHLPVNQKAFNDVISEITGGHPEVKIKWIGYDRNKAIEEYKKEAMKDLNRYDPKKSKKATQAEILKAKKELERLGFKYD